MTLIHCKITAEGLKHLKGLRIEHLELSSFNVTGDKELEQMKELAHLTYLDLSNCLMVTDKGLEHLEGLNKLNVLKLHECQITHEGIKTFQRNPESNTYQFEILRPSLSAMDWDISKSTSTVIVFEFL